MDIEFDISSEAMVTPLRGEEENPHHTHIIRQFKEDEEVKLFAMQNRDGRTAKEWLDWWLDQKLTSIGNISPKHAIISGRLHLVMERVRQSLRSSKRLQR